MFRCPKRPAPAPVDRSEGTEATGRAFPDAAVHYFPYSSFSRVPDARRNCYLALEPPATHAAEYNAHPQRIRGRVPARRVSARRRIRTLASRTLGRARAFVCQAARTRRPGTAARHAAARHPRGKRIRGSECFAVPREPPAGPGNPRPQHLARKSKHSFGFINFAFNSGDAGEESRPGTEEEQRAGGTRVNIVR